MALRRCVVVALLVAGCAPSEPAPASSAAITNGADDDGDPAVVTILDQDDVAGCSGSLIAPHTILTAAHCMIGPAQVGVYQVFFGSSVAAGGTRADLSDARAHPGFDLATFANDLALLTIRQAAPAAPLPLDPRALDASLVGQSFLAVGFGMTGAMAGDGGRKRSGTVQVSAVGAADFTAVAAPSQPCAGDSGGPALFSVAGTSYVTGVVSHGDSACASQAVYARVDTATAGFIQPYLDSTAAGSANPGDRCFYDEQCAGGPCLQATDEPKLWFCSRACQRSSDCPAGMTCAADGCRWPAPSPGAFGGACAEDDQCLTGLCKAGACTAHCVATGMTCPSGFACENTSGIDFVCVKAPMRGCAFAATSLGGGSGAALLLVCAILILRRRRVLALLLAVGCGGSARETAPLVNAVPATLPVSVPVTELLGAAACAECHRPIYEAWIRSPHGRAMTLPSAQSVLGDFAARPVTDGNETVGLSAGPDGFFMETRGPAGGDRRRVDLVLASGRQHQLYVTHGADGGWGLLPLIWSTPTKEWLPTSLYQPGGEDARDLTRGCFFCHLSQAYRRVGAGAAESAWIDLSINCESCHGPGREHVRRRRAGLAGEVYRDLRGLGGEEEARVCGPCHGFQLKPYVFPRARDQLPEVFVSTLIGNGLRPDGTQRSTTYQYAGHVLSGCFRAGALTCKGCHEPHALAPRDFIGEPAGGAHSDRQCTICHRDRLGAAEARHHSHHRALRCIDCHMAYSWIMDDERRTQRTADHSISIPRPRESIELKTPNACTTCHHDRSAEWALAALRGWGARRALEVRPWVETISLARKSAPGATRRLLALLDDPASGRYLRASALDLLAQQPPDPALVPALAPLAAASDVQARALAIRALNTHDAANRRRWLELGLADAHPFVRMETFSLVNDPSLLSPAAIARQLDDTLAHLQPPTAGLVHLITVRHKRGELREALALVDRLAAIALPLEQKQLHLDDVRARLVQNLNFEQLEQHPRLQER